METSSFKRKRLVAKKINRVDQLIGSELIADKRQHFFVLTDNKQSSLCFPFFMQSKRNNEHQTDSKNNDTNLVFSVAR